MQDYMIDIDNVTKRYILGQIGGTTLHEEIQRRVAKKLGNEDPNSKIGAKSYADGEEFWALSGVSFKIKPGERVGIIGHNGAGKSTLLKLLSRVTAPTSGEIGLNGRVTSMLEVGTGFHGELTGRENIYMNGAILGMSKKEIDKKIDEIIEFSECSQFIDTPVKRYSSGMYVKLAFSVAAHLDSEIMIMDEVLAVGDMAFQKKCLDKMNAVSRLEGRTILYVSHNMNTIRQLCERVIVLDHGKVVYDGDVENGISIYLGINSDVSSSRIDLTEIESECFTPDSVSFRYIDTCDNNGWTIKTGEKLCFEIGIVAKNKLNDVGFRIGIINEYSTPVSLLLADKKFDCNENEELKLKYEADFSLLVPGKYILTLTLFGADEFGNWVFYDLKNNAMTFAVEESANFNDNIKWNRTHWGSVKLPNLRSIN